jgi:hypothetical protein
LSAVFDIKFLTVVSLTYRRILYIGWDAQKLTKQIDGFTNMLEYEPNRCCVGIQPEGCILFINPIKREMTGKLILLQDF